MIFLQTLFYSIVLLSPTNVHAQLGNPTVDAMIGINARPQDHPLNNRIRRFNHVRTFHQWAENVGEAPSARARRTVDWPNTAVNPQTEVFLQYRYNFSHNGNSNYRTDDFYQGVSGRVSPALKDIAPAMRGLSVNTAQAATGSYSEIPYEQKPVNVAEGINFNWNGNETHNPTWGDLEAHNTPLAYRSYALQTTMFAARYGGRHYKPQTNYQTRFIQPHLQTNTLVPAVEQLPLASGLNSVDFMEIYNEPEKEWRDAQASIAARETVWRMWPDEYAAMHSAAADGHCRDAQFQIQPQVLLNEQGERAFLGIRNADPGMRIVAGSLADLRGQYFEEVFQWCEANRTGTGCQAGVGGNRRLPFDILNVHHYSSTASAQANVNDQYTQHTRTIFNGPGASPEQDDLRFRLRYFALRLRSTVPAYAQMPIWFTEFGYDHAGVSQITIPVINGQTTLHTQAQWYMRALLEVATSGVVDRATLYEIRDEPGGGEGVFNTCGIINRNGQPKESWYYVQTLRNVLSGYRYEGIISPVVSFPNLNTSLDPIKAESDWQNSLKSANQLDGGNTGNPSSGTGKPRMYRFVNAANQVIYAVWSPTHSRLSYNTDITVDYSGAVAASLIRTVNLDENGVWQDWSNNLQLNGTRLTIKDVPVSETPIFIVLGVARTSEIPVAVNPNDIRTEGACCGDVKFNLQTPSCAFCTYRIYYGLTNATNAILDIADPDIRLLSETAAGTEFLLTGIIAGQAYNVWIVPVSIDGDLPTGPLTSIQVTSNGVCTNCMINVLGTSSIMYPGANTPGSSTATQMGSILSNAEACGSGRPISTWDAWDWNTNNPLSTQVEIVFDGPMRITAAHYFDGAGEGQIEFEYLSCCSNTWRPWTIITTKLYDEWVKDGSFRGLVRGIRFKKLSEGARINSLMFCGEPASCTAEPEPPVDERAPIIKTDFSGGTSAELSWKPVFEWQNTAFEPMKGYEVLYAEALDGNTLSKPVKLRVLGSNESFGTEVSLRNLKPGTTYYGVVRQAEASDAEPTDVPFETIDPTPIPCESSKFSSKFILQTDAEQSSSQGLQSSPNLVLPITIQDAEVTPNPTSGLCTIRFKEKGYQSALVVEAGTGRVIKKLKVPVDATQIEVDLTNQPPGKYFVHVQDGTARDFTASVLLLSDK
jgi:hypothetical protein